MGVNNVNQVLEETNDISFLTLDGREVTQGTLVWEANQDGDKSFNLNVKPHSGWEIQKTFHITIFDIQGYPASSGSGEPSPTSGTVALTVCTDFIYMSWFKMFNYM